MVISYGISDVIFNCFFVDPGMPFHQHLCSNDAVLVLTYSIDEVVDICEGKSTVKEKNLVNDSIGWASLKKKTSRMDDFDQNPGLFHKESALWRFHQLEKLAVHNMFCF